MSDRSLADFLLAVHFFPSAAQRIRDHFDSTEIDLSFFSQINIAVDGFTINLMEYL